MREAHMPCFHFSPFDTAWWKWSSLRSTWRGCIVVCYKYDMSCVAQDGMCKVLLRVVWIAFKWCRNTFDDLDWQKASWRRVVWLIQEIKTAFQIFAKLKSLPLLQLWNLFGQVTWTHSANSRKEKPNHLNTSAFWLLSLLLFFKTILISCDKLSQNSS